MRTSQSRGKCPQCPEAGCQVKGLSKAEEQLVSLFFCNDRIIIYLWFAVPDRARLGGALRGRAWPEPPGPALGAVVRVGDSRSHTDPTGPLPSPAHWGMPGSRLSHTPSYLILLPPPPPPLPLVRKPLLGSLAEREALESGGGSSQGAEAAGSPISPATLPRPPHEGRASF